jgi:MinD superfamily P-loop ATPase
MTAGGAARTLVVTVYSWAGGTGRTSTVAALGVLLAARGLRVGLMDTHLAAPRLHSQFDLPPAAEQLNLADYLFGSDEIESVGYDVTAACAGPVPAAGTLTLVPCRVSGAEELGHALARHIDLGLLADGIDRLARQRELDVLLVDTQNGINRSAVVPLIAADLQVLLVDGSVSEREGMTSLGPLLAGPEQSLIVLSASAGEAVVRHIGGLPVATALPYATELRRDCRASQFLWDHPRHPLTQRLGDLADHVENRIALARLFTPAFSQRPA